ncbi:hypothetical protein [Pseudomonas protegens]|uniref:hypothetical protein n=1 Tax=Pseudomonas protegens TaxID=380021 RepID=UPI000AFE656C|nr:hypothetical protein [Pseudomonas protegens]
MLNRIFKHFHFCCDLGSGAKGFNRIRSVVGNIPVWVQPVAIALSIAQQEAQ